METFSVTKVVTKNMFSDWFQGLRNLIGHNLKGYEKMVEKGVEECWKEITEKGIKPKWYRTSMDQLTNGAMVIHIYGEK